MGHFSVAVFTTDNRRSLAKLLAAYDGNTVNNPNAKWDWYTIGGLWKDSLILKGKKKGCDAAFVPDIDFEAMKRRAVAELRPFEKATKDSCLSEKAMRERHPTEQEYSERLPAFSTCAVITPNGRWHESDTSDDLWAWDLNYYDRFIKPALENNWHMAIVDCHI